MVLLVRALALVGAVLVPALASAHGPAPGEEIDVRLDPLAPELAGVRAQVHRTAGYQLVVENTSDRSLEILDARGLPFLRIGPDGVEGNLSAPHWYLTFSPEGGSVPPEVAARARSGEIPAARWTRVRKEPSWGWFDARIDPEKHGSADHGARRFEIPVRIGEVASALRGRFVARALRAGTPVARLLSPSELAPGVRISLVPGPVASFLLQSDSAEPITVLGRDGEPFVRLSPAGVDGNVRSATFAEAARLRGGASLALEPKAGEPPQWQRLTNVPSYAWVDLRTAYPEEDVPESVAKGGASAELLRWAVPVRIGAGEGAPVVRIEGVTEWKPLASGPPRPRRQ